MPFLLIKNLPRYECLIEASKQFPDLDPSACSVFLHLMQAGDEAFRVVNSHLAEHGISQGRFMVLMLLSNQLSACPRAKTPAELADMSQVTRATMTGLIDTLERDDLVRRQPDLTDRRQMSVTLTSKGQAVLHSILPVHFKRMAALMAPLTEHERTLLTELLTKVMRQASNVDSVLSPAPVSAQAS